MPLWGAKFYVFKLVAIPFSLDVYFIVVFSWPFSTTSNNLPYNLPLKYKRPIKNNWPHKAHIWVPFVHQSQLVSKEQDVV